MDRIHLALGDASDGQDLRGGVPHRSRLMSPSRKIEAIFARECDEAFGAMPPEPP